jgi:hypothetical protein
MAPIHATILATLIIAIAAVGVAGATVYMGGSGVSPKADRLPAIASADRHVTVETRQNDVSILRRFRLD